LKLVLFLQILSIWIGEPTNHTEIEVFSNPLVKKTTIVVIEEYIQEYSMLKITKEKDKADIWVYPTFEHYIRPNIETSLAIMKSKQEVVGLEMRLTFEHRRHNFKQNLKGEADLIKDIRSNFLSVEESEEDFAEGLLFNLIKKTIDKCFKDFYLLIF
jgi:hypothetical protein